MTPNEFRDSVAFASGVSYERRRLGELLRTRANHVSALDDHFHQKGYRMVVSELRRLADQLDATP
jgi:hypothetical protein